MRPRRWWVLLFPVFLVPTRNLVAQGEDIVPPLSCPRGEGTPLFRIWSEHFRRPFDLEAAGWLLEGPGKWQVENGWLDAGRNEGGGVCIAVLPREPIRGVRDYRVEVDVWNTMREGRFFVACRYSDSANYYALEYRTEGKERAALLVRVLDGERSILASEDTRIGDSRVPDLTCGAGPAWASKVCLAVVGGRLCGSINREVVLNAVDHALPTGGIALGHESYHPFFDNLSIQGVEDQQPGKADVEIAREAGPPETRKSSVVIVTVADRDEALGLVQDLSELGVKEAGVSTEEGRVKVRVRLSGELGEKPGVMELIELFEYQYEESPGDP